MSELVVAGPSVGIGEHLVRLGALLERELRLLIARIAVRVILHGEPSVRTLDLVSARGPFDGQDFVVAAGRGHADIDSLIGVADGGGSVEIRGLDRSHDRLGVDGAFS